MALHNNEFNYIHTEEKAGIPFLLNNIPPKMLNMVNMIDQPQGSCGVGDTGELRYDGPLYDGLASMTDDMLGLSSMHIKYVTYVFDGFCI